VSETLLDFASPLTGDLGDLLDLGDVHEVLALAITAWNAAVLDAWEQGA
jgi:hypothetical protein